jgi:hypothetical protein
MLSTVAQVIAVTRSKMLANQARNQIRLPVAAAGQY